MIPIVRGIHRLDVGKGLFRGVGIKIRVAYPGY
jgi:hypothetical protein